MSQAPEAERDWVGVCGFAAKANEVCLVPDENGGIARVLAGVGEDETHWAYAGLAEKHPAGTYRLDAAVIRDRARGGRRRAPRQRRAGRKGPA